MCVATTAASNAALILWSVTQVLYLSRPPLASARASGPNAESVCARGARIAVVDMLFSLVGVCFDYLMTDNRRSGDRDRGGLQKDGLDFQRDLDVIADEQTTGLERHIPGQAPILAVDGGVGAEAGVQVAHRV